MPLFISIILLGIIEGITEFLPVSSTAHLLIAEYWLPPQSEVFNVVIQAGAVLAVIPLFKGRFYQFIYRTTDPATGDYLAKLVVAFVITVAGGLIMDKKGWKLKAEPGSNSVTLFNHPFNTSYLTIGLALLLGGLFFLLVEFLIKGKKRTSQISWTVAFAVGIGQLIAAGLPGASRSGTTIMFSLLLGVSRVAATEFSFLVSIPTMIGASAWTLFKTFQHPNRMAPREDWEMLILGCVVAALVSFMAVAWLLRYVQSHTFKSFGWYRIAIGIFVLAFIAYGNREPVSITPPIPKQSLTVPQAQPAGTNLNLEH